MYRLRRTSPISWSAVLGPRRRRPCSAASSNGERLAAAGRTLPHLIPFTEPIAAEDYLDPGTVLDELGLEGEMGRVDIPVLGAFTGRGVAKFGLAVATDPLIYTRVGGLTPRGVRAIKGVGPSGKAFYRHALRQAKKTGKLPSSLGVAAEAGHRNLLTFMGQPIRPSPTPTSHYSLPSLRPS
jgi:hypothetical protein